jgi:hypothetical protein
MESRKQYLIGRVSGLLRERGLKVSREKQLVGSVGVDLVCRSGSSDLLVKCKAMNLYRASDFRAAIGDAILRFQHEHRAERRRSSRLMLAFLLRRMSRKAEDDLREYSREYLSELQWAIIAEDGSGILHIGGHDERISGPPFQSVLHGESIGSRASLFSPNNQWLFKMLLLSGIDSRYWSGPSRRPKGISELAEVSGVPQPSVSAFVIKAEQEGFLKRGPQGFLIQNHQELLDDWSYTLKNRARRSVGFRFLYPDEPEEKFLRKLRLFCREQEAMPVVVGGSLGCHLLGLARSNVRNARLYAAIAIEKVLSALDLVEEKSESSHLSLIVRPAKDSVFRCAVRVNGVPVCDILQGYFDVRFSYARGREQADYIYERILQPHFERVV